MSAVFLLVSSRDALDPAAPRSEAARPYVPFVPEGHRRELSGTRQDRLDVWWTVPEAARGNYVSGALDDAKGLLVFDGQVAEPEDVAVERSVAEGLHARLDGMDWDTLTSRVDGDWVALGCVDGRWTGGTDFLGACHLYFGERDGVAVVSNRAMVAAAALWGSLPEARAEELAFLHAAFSCPLGRRTCWPGIEMVAPESLLNVREGRVSITPKAYRDPRSPISFDEAFEELKERASAISRFPALPFRLTVTGGKDSRAVLGALVAAGQIDRIQSCYLEGDPEAPDAIVGRALAEHYGLEFEVDEAPLSRHNDLFEAFAVHNFQAELALNAWDVKGAHTKARVGDVRGYYGEIYKTHDLGVFRLGWPSVRLAYLSPWFLDPWRILTARGRNHLREAMDGYLRRCKEAGFAAAGMHHRFHREMRMVRWCGQAQRSDAMGALALNPLASHRLFHRYFSLSRADQAKCRIHFELIRRADPWLVKQPFADYRWKLPGVDSPPPQAPPKASFYKSPQLTQWERQGTELVEFLGKSHGAEAFFAVYDRKALHKLAQKTLHKPTHRRLKAVMAAVAIKHALQFGVTPQPFTVTP